MLASIPRKHRPVKKHRLFVQYKLGVAAFTHDQSRLAMRGHVDDAVAKARDSG